MRKLFLFPPVRLMYGTKSTDASLFPRLDEYSLRKTGRWRWDPHGYQDKIIETPPYPQTPCPRSKDPLYGRSHMTTLHLRIHQKKKILYKKKKKKH